MAALHEELNLPDPFVADEVSTRLLFKIPSLDIVGTMAQRPYVEVEDGFIVYEALRAT